MGCTCLWWGHDELVKQNRHTHLEGRNIFRLSRWRGAINFSSNSLPDRFIWYFQPQQERQRVSSSLGQSTFKLAASWNFKGCQGNSTSLRLWLRLSGLRGVWNSGSQAGNQDRNLQDGPHVDDNVADCENSYAGIDRPVLQQHWERIHLCSGPDQQIQTIQVNPCAAVSTLLIPPSIPTSSFSCSCFFPRPPFFQI